MERPEFIKELEVQFPGAFAQINAYKSGILHCEMAAFRRFVEETMDEGAAWYCETAFRFVEQCRKAAGPKLANAIDMSFIEDLALGEQNTRRYDIVKERAPQTIRDKMIHVHGFWR